MAQAKRRKTTRRKAPARTIAGIPSWALLALGVGIGVLLILAVELVVEHSRSVSGIGSALHAPKGAARHPGAGGKTGQPKYDFYTILPGIETVLPARTRAERAKEAAAKPNPDVSYVLQVGSFPRYADADRLKAELALDGFVAEIQTITIPGKGEFNRVRLGPYAKLAQMDAVDTELQQHGIHALRLQVREPPPPSKKP